MTYDEIVMIAEWLWGSHWRQQLIKSVGGGPATLSNWKKQGVPKRVIKMMPSIAEKRLEEINKAVEYLNRG